MSTETKNETLDDLFSSAAAEVLTGDAAPGQEAEAKTPEPPVSKKPEETPKDNPPKQPDQTPDQLTTAVSALTEVTRLMQADRERRLAREKSEQEHYSAPKIPDSVNPRQFFEELYRDPKGARERYGLNNSVEFEDLAGSLIADSLGEESAADLQLRRQLMEQRHELAQLRQSLEKDQKERAEAEEAKKKALELDNFVAEYKKGLHESLDDPEFKPIVDRFGKEDAAKRLFKYATFLSHNLEKGQDEPTPKEAIARYKEEFFVTPSATEDKKSAKEESAQTTTQALNLQGDQAGTTEIEADSFDDFLRQTAAAVIAGM